MISMSRRKFLALGCGLAGAAAVTRSGWQWVCEVPSVDALLARLPRNVIVRAKQVKPLLAGIPENKEYTAQLMAGIESPGACPRINVLDMVGKMMAKDVRRGDVKTISGWLVPGAAIDLAHIIAT